MLDEFFPKEIMIVSQNSNQVRSKCITFDPFRLHAYTRSKVSFLSSFNTDGLQF